MIFKNIANRVKMLPYEHLRLIGRYKQTKTHLKGKPFLVADGMSFYYSYKEIFLQNIYLFDCKKKQPVILDCGSNYGTSIVYFKTHYPDAIITGVEADPSIYALLKSNVETRKYADVTLINKAISTKDEKLTFWSEGADGGRVSEGENLTGNSVSVDPVNLDSLITGPIDFLKMDIEGAENEVIVASKKLNLVSQMFIEYHSFDKSPQRLNEILAKLSEEGFRYYIHTQFCSATPFTKRDLQLDMDLQLNIFAVRD